MSHAATRVSISAISPPTGNFITGITFTTGNFSIREIRQTDKHMAHELFGEKGRGSAFGDAAQVKALEVRVDEWILGWQGGSPFNPMVIEDKLDGKRVGFLHLNARPSAPGTASCLLVLTEEHRSARIAAEIAPVIKLFGAMITSRKISVNGRPFSGVVAMVNPTDEISMAFYNSAGFRQSGGTEDFTHFQLRFVSAAGEEEPCKEDDDEAAAAAPEWGDSGGEEEGWAEAAPAPASQAGARKLPAGVAIEDLTILDSDEET